MGFFDFIKDAGAKLIGADEKKPEVPQAREITAEEMDRRRGSALTEIVKRSGMTVEGLQIDVKGDMATVHGTVPSQMMREKVVLTVGNTMGIARVDDRMQVLTPEPPAVFYTVQRGDTLSKIAKEQYGNAMKYPVIFEANRPMLENPDKIYPGQVLRIPPLD